MKPPPSGAAGIYRFNGELVVRATGRLLHPKAYSQDAAIQSAG